MPRALCAVFVSVFILAGTATAQDFSEKIEQALEDMEARKEENIRSVINLEKDKIEEFRDLYEEFQEALRKKNERYVEIAWQYLDRSGELNDDQARKFVGEVLELDESRVKLRNGYMKKFGQILPPLQFVHFFQLDNKTEAAFMYDLATHIPLLE